MNTTLWLVWAVTISALAIFVAYLCGPPRKTTYRIVSDGKYHRIQRAGLFRWRNERNSSGAIINFFGVEDAKTHITLLRHGQKRNWKEVWRDPPQHYKKGGMV